MKIMSEPNNKNKKIYSDEREILNEDVKLSELFKTELPEAPHDPWFVRKTMNRLPDKQNKFTGKFFSRLCYALAGVGFVSGSIWGLKTFLEDPTSTLGLMSLVVPPLAAMLCVGVIAAPALRRITLEE